MLNEFERRFLEVTQNHLDLLEVVKSVGGLVPEYFSYGIQIGAATAPLVQNVTQQGNIAIQADAWFVIEYVSAAVVLPAGSTYGDLTQFTDAGNIQLQLTDTGAGQEIYNIPSGFPGFPATLNCGSPLAAAAGIPYVFPTPRLVPPNTNIKVEATQMGNVAGTNPSPLGFYVVLSGARVPLGGG